MIGIEKIKKGLFFTLPCEFDEGKGLYSYKTYVKGKNYLLHYTHCENSIFRINGIEPCSDTDDVFFDVSCCDLDFGTTIYMKRSFISEFGSEINVNAKDKRKINKIYEKVLEIESHGLYSFHKEESEPQKELLNNLLSNYFNGSFRKRYNQKRRNEV